MRSSLLRDVSWSSQCETRLPFIPFYYFCNTSTIILISILLAHNQNDVDKFFRNRRLETQNLRLHPYGPFGILENPVAHADALIAFAFARFFLVPIVAVWHGTNPITFVHFQSNLQHEKLLRQIVWNEIKSNPLIICWNISKKIRSNTNSGMILMFVSIPSWSQRSWDVIE